MFSFHMRGPEKEKQCTLREAKQNALEYYLLSSDLLSKYYIISLMCVDL